MIEVHFFVVVLNDFFQRLAAFILSQVTAFNRFSGH